MTQNGNDGRIAGVHVATLLRNLEESTINEGSYDLFCRCKDAFAVLDRLLGEEGPRATALAEAAGLVSTIMADTFKRDDCSEEFLNGMAYGVASYCSAIKALGKLAAQAPQAGATAASTSTTNEGRLQNLEQGAQAAQAEAWRTVCAVLEELQPGWGNAPGTGIDVAVATIRALAARPATVQPNPAADDLLSALLWLYRRLPRGYGRQDHIEQPIKALAAQIGTDVAADLAERVQQVTERPVRAIDTFVGQPFAIVQGYEVGSDQPSLACFTGNGYEFADGDVYQRVGDTLAGFSAEFLTLFQLEQRLVAAAPPPAGCPACREKAQEDAIVDAAHAAGVTGQVELTFIDQRGIDRPTDVAKAFVRELAKFKALHHDEATGEELHTGLRVTDVAQMLNDLDWSTRWGTKEVADVCRRAGEVIRGLLNGLSTSQLDGVAGPEDGQKMEEVR